MNELEQFVHGDDRQHTGPTPFFAGRERELRSFLNALEFAKQGDVKGKTLVYQGAPGAGKTALLEECASRATENGAEKAQSPGKTIVSVEAQPEQLTSVDGLFNEVYATVKQKAPQLAKGAERFVRGLADRGITVQGLGFGAGVGPKRQEGLDAVSKFKELEKAWQDLTIVLLVDEAQSIPTTDVSSAIVKYLHAGTKSSTVLLVCFGLSDTTDKLVDLGISRASLARVHNLSTLTTPAAIAKQAKRGESKVGWASDARNAVSEAEQVILKTFETFGVKGSTAEWNRWITKLADTSRGWPQHLRILSQAALKELMDHDLDLACASINRVMEHGLFGMREFYAARLVTTQRWQPACREVARQLEAYAWLPEEDIERIVAPFVQRRQSSFDNFLAAAVHAGVLSPVSDKGYAVPIPSFADYLREDISPPKAGAENQIDIETELRPNA